MLLIWTPEMISKRSLLQLSPAINSSDSFFTQYNVIANTFFSFWLLFLRTLLGCRLINIREFNYIFNLKVYFICLGDKGSVCTCVCVCVCIHIRTCTVPKVWLYLHKCAVGKSQWHLDLNSQLINSENLLNWNSYI